MAAKSASLNAMDCDAIYSRYRSYCDACQSAELGKLKEFWLLPATFTMDIGAGQVVNQLVESYEELEKLYSFEFGSSTGVDQTIIDYSDINFYGDSLATIATSLRHLAKGKLHDTQTASYGCRKVEGVWWFISHISCVQSEPR